MYQPLPIFDVVTTCGKADVALDAHIVFEVELVDSGAVITFPSINSWEALDHIDCSSPSEIFPAMDL